MAISVITDAAFTSYVDALIKIYLRIRGADPAGTGSPSNPNEYGLGLEDGDWGAWVLTDDVVDAVVECADAGQEGIDAIVALASASRSLRSRITTKAVASSLLGDPLSALQSHVASAAVDGAVSDLDTYLTFRNTAEATKWKLLMPPAYYLLYNDVRGVAPAINNIWFEVLQGSVYTNALGKLTVSGDVFEAGFDVDDTKYCGGFPKINVVSVTGTGIITVTGTAYNPDTKATATNRTWVYSLASATPGVYSLVPGGANAAPTDSLIMGVDDISVAAGITLGVMYAEAHRPTGRDAFSY